MSQPVVDPAVLAVLACPDTHHAPLTEIAPGPQYAEGALRCTECGRVFRVVDGIPDLLLEDAVPPTDLPATDGTDA